MRIRSLLGLALSGLLKAAAPDHMVACHLY